MGIWEEKEIVAVNTVHIYEIKKNYSESKMEINR